MEEGVGGEACHGFPWVNILPPPKFNARTITVWRAREMYLWNTVFLGNSGL